MKNGMKRNRVAALVFAGLALLAAVMLLGAGSRKQAAAPEETVRVERRVVDNTVELFGRLKARVEQEIRAPLGGSVERVFAGLGQDIRKGDPIAVLSSDEAAFQLKKFLYELEQERFSGNSRRIELMEAEYELKKKQLADLTIQIGRASCRERV